MAKIPSLPMRGEWIEICPSPFEIVKKLSLPMRGEWIEIVRIIMHFCTVVLSLPMRGEWIEISPSRHRDLMRQCLSPCGESGLKYFSAQVHR